MSGATSRTECALARPTRTTAAVAFGGGIGHSRGGWHDPSSQAPPQFEPSILALFLLLAVPVFFTIIALTYVSSDNIAQGDAAELQQRFRTDAQVNIEEEFNPLKSLVRPAVVVR